MNQRRKKRIARVSNQRVVFRDAHRIIPQNLVTFGQPLEAMIVDVHVGVPRPELVDKAEVLAVLPYGKGTVTVVEGGLEVRNDAGTDGTMIANACAIVSLDIA